MTFGAVFTIVMIGFFVVLPIATVPVARGFVDGHFGYAKIDSYDAPFFGVYGVALLLQLLVASALGAIWVVIFHFGGPIIEAWDTVVL